MRFDQKIMNYCLGDITKTRLINCRKAIEKQAQNFGGSFTVLQVLTLKAMLKTLKSRIVKMNDSNLIKQFNYLFDDIISFDIKK